MPLIVARPADPRVDYQPAPADTERDRIDAPTIDPLQDQQAALLAQHAEIADQAALEESRFVGSFLDENEETVRPGGAWRVLQVLMTLLLTIALAAQACYWWRSELFYRIPALRPYLSAACHVISCDIDPPAQIEQLSIESSELVSLPAQPGVLAFTSLIRNHSNNPMAYPAIEITLTDARDQAVLRRVFLPATYLADPSQAHTIAGIPGNSEFPIKLTFDTSNVPTAGYRAGVFYP